MAETAVGERRRARRCVHLGGQRIDLIARNHLLAAVGDALDGRRARLQLMSANLDHIYRFEGEAELFESGDDGQWLVLLDGMPLVWATRARTGERWEKLAGADILPDLLDVAAARQAAVGFLGGDDELAAALPDCLGAQWPDLRLAGHWTPSRDVLTDEVASDALAREIRAAEVDLLVVGLGKPRQEHWTARHGAATGAQVVAGFGAAANFLAGVQARCPDVLARAGVEWAYRLYKEPRRLAKRYLAEGPVALGRVMTRR